MSRLMAKTLIYWSDHFIKDEGNVVPKVMAQFWHQFD